MKSKALDLLMVSLPLAWLACALSSSGRGTADETPEELVMLLDGKEC
jgi:hypothetical protein